MAIEFKQTHYAGHTPEFWRGEAKILPGGFKPKKDLPIGTVVRKATPVYVDFENLTAAIVKTAIVLAGGTTTKVRVPKGHYFAVGDMVAKSDDGAASPTISSIDKSNSDYDVLNLSAGITGVKENDIIVESTEKTETEAAKPLYVPNFVVGAEKVIDGKGLPTLDIAYDAIILVPSLAAPILPEWLQEGGKYGCLKNNHNIIYIKQ